MKFATVKISPSTSAAAKLTAQEKQVISHRIESGHAVSREHVLQQIIAKHKLA